MGNCWSKCFEEEKGDDVIDPKTPLLSENSAIKSIADSGTLSSKSFTSIFSSHAPPVDSEPPAVPPKAKRALAFPSPPTGRFSGPPRHPSRTDMSRHSVEFFTPPPVPSQPFTPSVSSSSPSSPSPSSPSPSSPSPSSPFPTSSPPSYAPTEPILQPTKPAQSTQPVQSTQSVQATQPPQTAPQPTQVTQHAHTTNATQSTQPAQVTNGDLEFSFPRPPSIPPAPDFDVHNPPSLRGSQTIQTGQTTTTQSASVQTTTNQPTQSQLTASQQTTNQQLTTSQTDQKDKTELPKDNAEPPKDKEKEKSKKEEKEKQNLSAAQLAKILTSRNDEHTPQERISQIIQTLLDLCREIGEISTSDAEADLSAETTLKKRLDVLTLKASKNTVQMCEVVETLTSIKKTETKRGKWEEELRENTRKASSKIEQLVIECRNANVEQRKTNVKTYIGDIEKLLDKIRAQVTQLVELVLAQGEVIKSAQSIIDATNKHSSVSGVETVLRSAKVAVSVVQRLVDSLANELVINETSDLKKAIAKTFYGATHDTKELDAALFVSNALHVCAMQLFDAIDTIAQAHFDPGVQLELWNKGKAVRGAGFLLQLSITEKNRELSDRCLSLSAASRVFASSVVDLIESSVSAVNMTPKYLTESGPAKAIIEEASENVWLDEERIAEIIIFDADLSSSSSVPLPRKVLASTSSSSPSSPPPSSSSPEKKEPSDNIAQSEIQTIESKIEQTEAEKDKVEDKGSEIEKEEEKVSEKEIEGEKASEQEKTEEKSSGVEKPSEEEEKQEKTNEDVKDGETEQKKESEEEGTKENKESVTTETPSPSSSPSLSSSSSSPAEVSTNLTTSAKLEGSGVITETAGKKLKAATLNGLLLYLIFDKIDIQYMETLALTYRSFVDSKPFFQKLVELYNVPESKGNQAIVIQSRVATFIKKWISLQVQDFSEDLVKVIATWAEETLQRDIHVKGVAKQILDLLANYNDQRTAVRKSFADALETKMHKEIAPIEFVLNMEPQEIAMQLTVIDHSIFRAIRPHELLFQSWNKPHLRHRAPNVLSMISRTNNIALWVASSILWHPKLSDRANVMTKLIVVAEHLRKLKNFNTMFAVLSGLQLSSVNRLKYTKEKVPKKQTQVFDSLVELMSSSKSFKAYREALAAEIPPCIPYLGLWLTDLTFVEEGNPDYISLPDSSKKLINFKKREKLFKVISDIQQYQNWKYPEMQGDKNSILEELPRNEEEQLYGMSLLREPRNANREQIV